MLKHTVTIGSGKSIHWGTDGGAICGANFRNGFFTAPKAVKAETATCKRCIRIMATEAEAAHAEALEMDAAQAEEILAVDIQPESKWVSGLGHEVAVTRVHHAHGVRVSFRRTGGAEVEGVETGTLPLAMFLEAFKRHVPAVEVLQVTARELLDTDVIVQHPETKAPHVIREIELAITRQRYGLTFTSLMMRDGKAQGRVRGALRYTDRVWVERRA